MKNTVYRLLPDGDSEAGMSPSDMVEKSMFTTDEQTETNHTFFQTEDESILSGVWTCAPCREDIDSYPVHEMMTVLSGSVTVTNEDGVAETFSRGDSFFIAKGSRCIWEITETLHKFYMIAA